MKRVLLVDDDPLVLRIYGEALTRNGLKVETAADGLAAMRSMRAARPDVVVLDLMMPKFSGTEVLKFMRGQPDLADLPVIVLSNAYMDALAQDAAATGAQRGLLKVRCTPSLLLATINELLEGQHKSWDTSSLLAVRKVEPPATSPARPVATEKPKPAPQPVPKPSPPPSRLEGAKNEDRELRVKARESFLANASAKSSGMRKQFQLFRDAKTDVERGLRLDSFYQMVHFLAAEAGLAECHRLALMASALEALLLQLMDTPARFTPSVLRTLASSLDLLDVLFLQIKDSDSPALPAADILVVDDDPLSNRLVVSALRQVHLRAVSVEDPARALQQMREKHYDLLLLDIEMPGMTGFELCRRLREIGGYEKTPVIYVTGHDDFENHAKSLELGAEDLIAKPVLPMELAAKVVMHLLRRSAAQPHA